MLQFVGRISMHVRYVCFMGRFQSSLFTTGLGNDKDTFCNDVTVRLRHLSLQDDDATRAMRHASMATKLVQITCIDTPKFPKLVYRNPAGVQVSS